MHDNHAPQDAPNALTEVEQQRQLPDTSVQFGTLVIDAPQMVIVRASEIAGELARIIEVKQLYVVIRNRKYVYCEGWTTLGAMLGVVPRELDTADVGDGEFVASVEIVRASDGLAVGKASASCGPDEKDWKGRSRQARRSMAQTRATSKAFRLSFSWVMQLAGYQPTPAEEAEGEIGPPRNDNPSHNDSAPKAPTRDDRVTTAEVQAVTADWKNCLNESDATPAAWSAWATKWAGREFNVRDVAEWTREDLRLCRQQVTREMGSVVE